jgi:hypothetical protein
MMRFLRFAPYVALVGMLWLDSASQAQNSKVTPRIGGPVDELALTRLRGGVPGMAQGQFDKGEASGSTQLTHMRIVLARSAEQQAALDQIESELQQKASPNYHMWLTPTQFGKLYGPADSDIAVIVGWLQGHGLTLESVPPGRTDIAFSGTVSQVEEAFHISIHSYEIRGRQFLSNSADPQIPSALAPVIKGIAHLNTIQPRPHSVHGNPGKLNSETKRLERVNSASDSEASPFLTVGSGTTSAPYFLYIVPADAATIYDTPNTTLNANYATGTSYDGTGVTIGIGGDSIINSATVLNYRNTFLGNSTPPVITNVDGVTSTADAGEAYLDTEISGGLAPGAGIHFYTSTDLTSGISKAINDNAVDIFSLSFGACELDNSTADNALINGYWEQAAGQGIAVTVSTGDSGSAGCDATSSNNANVTAASGGLQVSGFASTPYNIAVGGTDFPGLNSAFSTYVSTSQGTAATYYRSALGYIPESTWNTSTQTDTTISANVRWTGTNPNIVAAGGGASSCSTNSTVDTSTTYKVGTCTSGYAKPTWQRGTGVPADGVRDLPDVSLMAGDGLDAADWLVCDDTTDTSTGNTKNCTLDSNNEFYFDGYGGTSTAAPTFAGILALVQQKTGNRLGQAAKEIYDLYNGSNAAAIFHDVKVGNISVPCSSGSSNCAKNSAGYYYETGYDTTAGYDLATGLGSVDAGQLITDWATSTGAASATVSAIASPTSVNSTQGLTVSVTVTGSGSLGTPTGTISLSGSGYSSSPQSLSNGTYTFTIPASVLTAGTDKLTATYSGDSNYATTTGNVVVTVAAGATVSAIASPTSVSSAQSLTVAVTVTGSGSLGTPTGTISLSGSGYSSSHQSLTNGTYTFTIPAGVLKAGTDTLTATYSGDSNYASTTGNVVVTVAAGATVSAIASPTSVNSTQGLTVSVTVTGSGSLGTPTGTISLSGSGYSSSPQTLSNGTYTFTIPAGVLTAGTDTLTATYSGDSNYATTTGNVVVTVTASVYAVSASAPSAVSSGGTATSTITVNTASGYAGTVALSCVLASGPSGATLLPSCSLGSAGTVTLTSSSSTATGTVTITTTAATTAELAKPNLGGLGGAGSAVLALVLFIGIPARKRSWRAMLGVLILLAALTSLSACGSGGGGSSGIKTTPGTTAGTYTFTVTATGTPIVSPAPTATIALVVN